MGGDTLGEPSKVKTIELLSWCLAALDLMLVRWQRGSLPGTRSFSSYDELYMVTPQVSLAGRPQAGMGSAAQRGE